jgi:hypothetical protein
MSRNRGDEGSDRPVVPVRELIESGRRLVATAREVPEQIPRCRREL